MIAVRVADESEKEILIEMDPSVFFTEPHYNGYPAILVRLPAIDVETLETILRGAWRSRAPKSLLRATSSTETCPERSSTAARNRAPVGVDRA